MYLCITSEWFETPENAEGIKYNRRIMVYNNLQKSVGIGWSRESNKDWNSGEGEWWECIDIL